MLWNSFIVVAWSRLFFYNDVVVYCLPCLLLFVHMLRRVITVQDWLVYLITIICLVRHLKCFLFFSNVLFYSRWSHKGSVKPCV